MTPAEGKLPQRFHSIPAQGIYNATLFDSEHFALTSVSDLPYDENCSGTLISRRGSLKFRPSGSGPVSHKAINRTFEE